MSNPILTANNEIINNTSQIRLSHLAKQPNTMNYGDEFQQKAVKKSVLKKTLSKVTRNRTNVANMLRKEGANEAYQRTMTQLKTSETSGTYLPGIYNSK